MSLKDKETNILIQIFAADKAASNTSTERQNKMQRLFLSIECMSRSPFWPHSSVSRNGGKWRVEQNSSTRRERVSSPNLCCWPHFLYATWCGKRGVVIRHFTLRKLRFVSGCLRFLIAMRRNSTQWSLFWLTSSFSRDAETQHIWVIFGWPEVFREMQKLDEVKSSIVICIDVTDDGQDLQPNRRRNDWDSVKKN